MSKYYDFDKFCTVKELKGKNPYINKVPKERKPSLMGLEKSLGYTSHPFYHIWYAMHSRCYREKDKSYINYGGRGIKVCERWRNVYTFADDMGPKPSIHHTLERQDNDGDYEPGNCIWATRSENNSNRRKYFIFRLTKPKS